ncbi:MAG TPA: isoprenylcysteine carboxylmethyltransferase family protein [Candidatus Thermoplasmatota archaeon]|nr:isoprenylcysteine carboxylmethyltransferase family protein [Candidatus Thermoplasmatota archaeon]
MSAPPVLFWSLWGLLIASRLVELRVAHRHTRALLAKGAVEHDARGYRGIVLLHTAFILALPLEYLRSPLPSILPLGATIAALLVVAGAEALRASAVLTLGERWTTRILVLPGSPPVTRGPYRYLRHPNYLAVGLTLAALPLAFGLVATALATSVVNAMLLRRRIRAEEAALASVSNYQEALGERPRLLPRL